MVRVNRILGFFVILCICLNAKGQAELSINESFLNTPLDQALSTLSKNYDLIIAYDNDNVKGITVSAKLKNNSLKEALNILLTHTQLDYKIIQHNQIILKRKTEPTRGLVEEKQAPKKPLFIHGKVYDASTGKALQYASAYFVHKKNGVNTDINGYFKLPYPYLPDTLEISYLGFEKKTFPFSALTPGKLFKVYLTIKDHSLNDVIISDGSEQTISISDGANAIVLNPKKISALSPMGEADVLRALQTLPGVSSNNESASELNIRGGAPDQNLILFDGIPIYQPGHFYGVFSAFNANATKDVQLYRGGFSAKYGGRASSVLDITGKPGNPEKLTGGVSANLMNLNAYLETPLFNKKGALMIAARRSFSDVIQSSFYNKLFDNIFQQGYIYNQNNRKIYDSLNLSLDPKFLFEDFNAKFTYQLSEKDLLSISTYQGKDLLTYGSREDINTDFILATADTLLLKNRGVSVSWARQWSQRLYSKTQLVYSNFNQNHIYQYGFYDKNGEGNWYQFPRENNLTSLSFKQDNEWDISPKHRLIFGTEITDYQVEYKDRLFSADEILLDDKTSRKGKVFAGYAEHNYRPNDKLEINLGGRYQYYDRTQKNYWEPRISAKVNLTDKFNLKAAWTRHHQFVSNIIQYNGLSVGENFWALGDEDSIQVVNSEHFILGAAYETEDFLIDIELYHKITKGLFTYTYFVDERIEDKVDSDIEIEKISLASGGISIAKGIDIIIQKKIGKYTGWLSYSLSKVDLKFPTINQGNPFPAAQDHRHNLSLINIFSLDEWEFSLNWNYASGKPFTDIVQQNIARTPNNEDEFKISLGERNANRLPTYHRLDVSATYKIPHPQKLWKTKVGISVFNLYNRKNVRDFRYTVVTDPKRNQSELVSTSRNLLGFSPNLFLNITF